MVFNQGGAFDWSFAAEPQPERQQQLIAPTMGKAMAEVPAQRDGLAVVHRTTSNKGARNENHRHDQDAALEQGARGIRVQPPVIPDRSRPDDFKRADEVFAGTPVRRSQRPSRWVAWDAGGRGQAWLAFCCRRLRL